MPNVYTRTGDNGDTGLFGGSRVPKQSLRVEAYGTVDEANSHLGAAKAQLPEGQWRDRVHAIQQRIFVLAAELASDAEGVAQLTNLITADDVLALEKLIDDCLAIVGKQRGFVVPGRDKTSSEFHIARTVIRRAERRVLALSEIEAVRPELIKYLNRLSDAFYALARLTEHWSDLALIEKTVRAAVEKYVPKLTGELVQYDLQTAQAIGCAARERATQLGASIAFAAVDMAGDLMLFERMPDTLLASTDIAINKAWTALAFKTATANLSVLEADKSPYGIEVGNAGRVLIIGGGEVVRVDGKVVGGIGVSGGTIDQDLEIIQHALKSTMGVEK